MQSGCPSRCDKLVHPGVERAERASMTLLEVFKPAPQRAIDVFDDHPQALALGASRSKVNPPSTVPDGGAADLLLTGLPTNMQHIYTDFKI